MSDLYTEQLEMQLRFAEEEAQERERNAYYQGKADAIEEFAQAIEKGIEEDIKDDVISVWTKGTFMGMVKFVAEQMKEQK